MLRSVPVSVFYGTEISTTVKQERAGLRSVLARNGERHGLKIDAVLCHMSGKRQGFFRCSIFRAMLHGLEVATEEASTARRLVRADQHGTEVGTGVYQQFLGLGTVFSA